MGQEPGRDLVCRDDRDRREDREERGWESVGERKRDWRRRVVRREVVVVGESIVIGSFRVVSMEGV